MAAIFAASSGAETLLLERTKDGGRKILMSGGGRCNILPAVVHESRFVTDSSPHTLRKILRSWPLGEQIAFFEDEAGIPWTSPATVDTGLSMCRMACITEEVSNGQGGKEAVHEGV